MKHIIAIDKKKAEDLSRKIELPADGSVEIILLDAVRASLRSVDYNVFLGDEFTKQREAVREETLRKAFE